MHFGALKQTNHRVKTVYILNGTDNFGSLIKHEFLNITSDILDSRTYWQYKGVITLIYKHGNRDLLIYWRTIPLLNCCQMFRGTDKTKLAKSY